MPWCHAGWEDKILRLPAKLLQLSQHGRSSWNPRAFPSPTLRSGTKCLNATVLRGHPGSRGSYRVNCHCEIFPLNSL